MRFWASASNTTYAAMILVSEAGSICCCAFEAPMICPLLTSSVNHAVAATVGEGMDDKSLTEAIVLAGASVGAVAGTGAAGAAAGAAGAFCAVAITGAKAMANARSNSRECFKGKPVTDEVIDIKKNVPAKKKNNQ